MRFPLRPVDYMDPREMDYGMIEPGIRELVKQMNEVPFVETVSSCEGHLGDKIFKDASPDPGFTFISGGHIAFDLKPGHPDSDKFMREIGELAGSRSFSSLKDVEFGMETLHVVGFDTSPTGGHVSNLVRKQMIEDMDSNEVRLRKSLQVERVAAAERKEEYQKFWAEMSGIAKKYSKVR